MNNKWLPESDLQEIKTDHYGNIGEFEIPVFHRVFNEMDEMGDAGDYQAIEDATALRLMQCYKACAGLKIDATTELNAIFIEMFAILWDLHGNEMCGSHRAERLMTTVQSMIEKPDGG